MTDIVSPGQPKPLTDDTGMFNVQVAPRYTHEQRAADKAAAEERLKQKEDAHSWWDVTKAAVKMNQVVPMVIEQFATPKGADDDTPLDDDKLKELTEGIGTEYFDEFDGNETVGEAMRTRQRILDQLKAQEILMSKGAGTGIALSIAAGLTDPVAMAASIATGGLLAPVLYGAKATRVQRAVQAGLVGAAANVPIEAYMANRDVTYDASDAVIGLIAGGVISGAVGYKWPGKLPDVEQYTQRALNQEYVGELQKAGATHRPATDLLLPNSGNPDGTIKSAAQRNTDWFNDLERNAAGTSMKGARVDRSSFVHGSETEEVRKMGHALFDDPNAEIGSLQRETAAMFTINQTDEVMRRVALNRREAYGEFKKAMKTSKGDFSEDAFEEAIAKVMRGGTSNIPSVNKMAAFYKKEIQKIAEMSKNPGKGVPVKGSENMVIDDYLTRRWSTSKMAAKVATEGKAKVSATIAKALRGYPPQQAQAIADHLVDVVGRSKGGHLDLRFVGKNLDTMTSYFSREMGMDFHSARKAAEKLKRLTEGPDAGNANNLKFRLDLDESMVEDLLENNATNLFNSYARTMYGHIGLARQGIDSEDAFNALLDVARTKRMENHAKSGESKTWKADAELRYLQDAYDFVIGRAVGEDPGSFGATLGRLARKYNYARVMNVQAISALGDLGQVLSQVGLKAAIQHIPEMVAIHRRIRQGKFIDELSEETAQLTGWLNRSAVAKSRQRFEDFAAGGEVKETQWSKVERGADFAGRVTGHISGINALQDMTQRLAGKAMIQTFLDAARTGKAHRLGDARLRELGVSEELMGRIKTEMMKKGNASWDSLGRIKKLNIDKWDYETRLQFGMVLRRWGGYLVQEQHFGSLPGLYDTSAGKILSQFRSFQTGAWVKQTLYNVKHHDRIATQAFIWSILTGALSFYVAVQAGMMLLPEDKRSEYLERRLGSADEPDWTKVAAQSFMRSGISSFIPGIVDTATAPFVEEPLFGQRNSGLAQGFIGGNPTLDALTKMEGALTATAQAIKQGEATKDMVDAWHSALIWQNALGVRNGLYHLTKDMPEFQDDSD